MRARHSGRLYKAETQLLVTANHLQRSFCMQIVIMGIQAERNLA